MSPWAPKRPCVEPKCAGFAMGRNARCEVHQRQAWRADNETDRVRGHNSAVHQAIKIQVLAEEDRCKNPYCANPFAPGTVDYIEPLVRGGRQVRENAQRLCLSCNSSRGAKSWESFLASGAERARLRATGGGGSKSPGGPAL
jgi:5-methylcytosine-specific restriction endonuclease McrA